MEDTNKVHPSALVSEDAQLGVGVQVWPFAQVLAGARIGAHTTIGHGCFVGEGVQIGERCKLQSHVSVFSGVVLEDDVFVGPHVTFTNVRRPRAFLSRKHEFEATLVERGATIGAGAVVRSGIVIGSYAMAGAGAVVTKDVPSHALVVGNPARCSGWVCRCGGVLQFDATKRAECSVCSENYQLDETAPTLFCSAPDVRVRLLL